MEKEIKKNDVGFDELDSCLNSIDGKDELRQELFEIEMLLMELKACRSSLETVLRRMKEAENQCEKQVKTLDSFKTTSENIVCGITHAILKAEKNTVFKAKLDKGEIDALDEKLASFLTLVEQKQSACEAAIEQKLTVHQAKIQQLVNVNSKKIEGMLQRSEGIWFSDFWMKVTGISLGICYLAMGICVLLN